MSKRLIDPLRPVWPGPAALVTSIAANGRPNIVTLGECFNVSIRQPVIVGIAIRTATYSHGLIREGGAFCVNLPTADMAAVVDGIGSVSGRECNKFERFGLTALPATQVAPPLIAECPVNLECRVLEEQEVGDHQMFLGQVVAQHADQSVLGEDGRPDPRKLDMLIYAEWNYFASGNWLGRHGSTG